METEKEEEEEEEKNQQQAVKGKENALATSRQNIPMHPNRPAILRAPGMPT